MGRTNPDERAGRALGAEAGGAELKPKELHAGCTPLHALALNLQDS